MTRHRPESPSSSTPVPRRRRRSLIATTIAVAMTCAGALAPSVATAAEGPSHPSTDAADAPARVFDQVVGERSEAILPGFPQGATLDYMTELPPGLHVDNTGRLIGVPTAAGTWRLRVQVTTAEGDEVELAYEIGVNPTYMAYAYYAGTTLVGVDMNGAENALITKSMLVNQGDIAVGPDGSVFVIDRDVVRRASLYGGDDIVLSGLSGAEALTVDANGVLYVWQRYGASGTEMIRLDLNTGRRTSIRIPGVVRAVGVDPEGGIWVSRYSAPTIDRVSPDGVTDTFDPGLGGRDVSSISTAPDGSVVVSATDGAMARIHASGAVERVADAEAKPSGIGRSALVPAWGLIREEGATIKGLERDIPAPGKTGIKAIAAAQSVSEFLYAASSAIELDSRDPLTFQLRGRGEFQAADELPKGIQVSSTGRVTGRIMEVGQYTIPFETLDNGHRATAELTIDVFVDPAISGTPHDTGSELDYSFQFDLSPGVRTRIMSGALPPGLQISESGLLSGHVGAVGGRTVYSFVVRAEDGEGRFADLAASIIVTPRTQIVESTHTLGGFGSESSGWRIPELQCPAGFRLVDEDLSPGRVVPRGVRVIEHDGLWVTVTGDNLMMNDAKFGGQVRKGIANGLAYNFNTGPRTVTIQLNCTNAL